jgi:hypothetical protein
MTNVVHHIQQEQPKFVIYLRVLSIVVSEVELITVRTLRYYSSYKAILDIDDMAIIELIMELHS